MRWDLTKYFAVISCVDAFSGFSTTWQSPSLICSRQLKLAKPIFSRCFNIFAEEKSGEESVEESNADESTNESNSSGSDILNSPAFLKRKIDVLKSDIGVAEESLARVNDSYEMNKAEYGDKLENLRKEYANIQDRLNKQNNSGKSASTKEVAEKFLTVLDNYDRAFGVIDATSDQEMDIETSYKEINVMIVNTLEELGVKKVETVGIEFDYELHQAVMMRPDGDYEEGIVCEELASGYSMEDGTLIRAAMVVVAA